jgi:hypothetical protein
MTTQALEEFLDTMRRAGWNVVGNKDDTLSLAASLLARYPRIPDAYLTFLRHVAQCSNLTEDAWFLCASDYNADGSDDTTFRWNEWERIGLDALADYQEEIERIKRFWDSHLPIMSAVHSDYAYLAISLAPAEYGAIVYGYGPEFEESARRVCGSFEEFLDTFGRVATGAAVADGEDGGDGPLAGREYRDFL